MVLEMFLCCLLVLALGTLLWRARAKLLTPVQPGENTALTVFVTASGAAPELESLLHGLLWLRDSGAMQADILLLDDGLTPEAATVAHKLAEQSGRIYVFPKDEDGPLWRKTEAKQN